jgi:hypothetical protein
MARSKSARPRRANARASSPRSSVSTVSDQDLAWLIKAQGTGETLSDEDRAQLASALTELQELRRASTNRTRGTKKAAAKRLSDRLDNLRCELDNHIRIRDESMQSARSCRSALQLLPPAELRTVVASHVGNARVRNRMAVQVKQQMRPLISEAIELRKAARS